MKITLIDEIIKIFLNNENQSLYLKDLYKKIINSDSGFARNSSSKNIQSSIRGVLNSNHSKKGRDIFYNPEIRSGLWALKDEFYFQKINSDDFLRGAGVDTTNLSDKEKTKMVKSIRYERDPKKRKEILNMWNKDYCPMCRQKTFKTKERFFFEVHHIDPLHSGGKDIIKNLIPLCSHCHSRIHYSIDQEKFNNDIKKFQSNFHK